MLICKRCYNKIEGKICDLVIVPGSCNICGITPACNYNNITRRTELFCALIKIGEGSPIIEMNCLAFLGGNMSFESFLLSTIVHQNQVISQMAVDLEENERAKFDVGVDALPCVESGEIKPPAIEPKKTWSRKKKH